VLSDGDCDGVADGADRCPGTALGAMTDSAGCSSPQRFEAMCPSSGTYRNHGQYVSCVAREAHAQMSLGLITRQQKGMVISTAAGSGVGKRRQ
jgi:hypothetical protein